MARARWIEPAAGAVAVLAALAVPAAAGAEEPGPAEAAGPPDPEVVAAREAAAMADPPPAYRNPPAVQPPSSEVTTSFSDLYVLASTSTQGGYVHVGARDNPAQDSPGYLTTTLRVYGNAAGFRSDAGKVTLRSQFTCSGAGVGSLTIGASGVSVTGGATSSTLTWDSSRSSSTEVRQFYSEGGHFRCKASNATPAKFTRRAIATATYKSADTRAQDDYSFWW